jgi:NarL family two-component system response regulator LiaR
MTTTPIRVLIVDDHAMIRRGLATYLMGRTDVVLVGEASDGQEALAAIPVVQPDIVLMDVQMPRMGGLEAVELLRRRYPAVKVVMLTSFQEQALAERALLAGASAYLLKDVAEEDLIAAIRLAYAGHVLLPPGAATRPAASPLASPSHDLSHREVEILSQVAAGLGNKEIAHNLALSLSTVKFHVSNVIAKLGASSRTEAAAIAIQRGIVSKS